MGELLECSNCKGLTETLYSLDLVCRICHEASFREEKSETLPSIPSKPEVTFMGRCKHSEVFGWCKICNPPQSKERILKGLEKTIELYSDKNHQPKVLTFNHYQNEASKTAIYPKCYVGKGLGSKNDLDYQFNEANWIYPILGLQNEIGELVSVVNNIDAYKDKDGELAIKKETGDVFWYLAEVCTTLNLSLQAIVDTDSSYTFVPPGLSLLLHASELSGIAKKAIRDNKGEITQVTLSKIQEVLIAITKNLVAMMRDYNIDVTEVLQMNLDKLQSRKERGVLTGSGDNR